MPQVARRFRKSMPSSVCRRIRRGIAPSSDSASILRGRSGICPSASIVDRNFLKVCRGGGFRHYRLLHLLRCHQERGRQKPSYSRPILEHIERQAFFEISTLEYPRQVLKTYLIYKPALVWSVLLSATLRTSDSLLLNSCGGRAGADPVARDLYTWRSAIASHRRRIHTHCRNLSGASTNCLERYCDRAGPDLLQVCWGWPAICGPAWVYPSNCAAKCPLMTQSGHLDYGCGHLLEENRFFKAPTEASGNLHGRLTMAFSSNFFIFAYLPVVLVIYFSKFQDG